MDKNRFKSFQRKRRIKRVRKSVFGDPERPRLAVFRSLRHVYCQIIDDVQGVTLVAAGSLDEELRSELSKGGGNVDAAGKVGEAVAKKALSLGIRQVRFDRKGYKYHGRVKALAEAARKGGLVF
jgi:large subunit ribosomal protein L18